MSNSTDNDSTQPPESEFWPTDWEDSQSDPLEEGFDSNNYDPLSLLVPERMCSLVNRKSVEVGSVYVIDHRHLPVRTPAHLRSIRVAMVSEKTKLNIAVRYPSPGSLETFFSNSIGEMYPALDEKFVMGTALATKVLVRQVPTQQFAENKHLKQFWLAGPTARKMDGIPLITGPESDDSYRKGNVLTVEEESIHPMAGEVEAELVADSEAYHACEIELVELRRERNKLRKTVVAQKLPKNLVHTSNSGENDVLLSMFEGGDQLNEIYISSLVSQLEESHRWIKYLDEENRILSSKLRSRDSENEVLEKRLNSLEHKIIPSLESALKDSAMEKDAAVVSLLLRMKKHFREVEEERCRVWLETRLAEIQAQSAIPKDKCSSRGDVGPVGKI